MGGTCHLLDASLIVSDSRPTTCIRHMKTCKWKSGKRSGVRVPSHPDSSSGRVMSSHPIHDSCQLLSLAQDVQMYLFYPNFYSVCEFGNLNWMNLGYLGSKSGKSRALGSHGALFYKAQLLPGRFLDRQPHNCIWAVTKTLVIAVGH